MSGPKILWYGKSILDCGLWPWLVCVIKGSWPIMSIFWGPFFHFFEKKNFSEKPFFLGLKLEWNLSVNTERSGTDYCWLYCGRNHGEMYAKFGKKKRLTIRSSLVHELYSFGNSGVSPDLACYIQHPFRIIESEHFLFRNHNIDPPITYWIPSYALT